MVKFFWAVLLMGVVDALDKHLIPGEVVSGDVVKGQIKEFVYTVDGNSFEENQFDVSIHLDVLQGDCDLVANGPRMLFAYSEHAAGADILFLPREKIFTACERISTCEIKVLVVGYTETAEYELLFETDFNSRELHPRDKAVLEDVYDNCCQTQGSCHEWSGLVSSNAKPTFVGFCKREDQVCDTEGHIVHLNLAQSGLRCGFPESLSRLESLQRLFLQNNFITGAFESVLQTVARMAGLKHLHMAGNNITGALRCCDGGGGGCFAGLKTLDLSRNGLEGGVPECVLGIPELGVLSLSGNRLSGTLPDVLADNPHMMILELSGQRGGGMHGPVPDLRPFGALTVAGLSGNRFSGRVPPVPPAVEVLALAGNALTGTLPAHYGELRRLKVLDLASNAATGTIPAGLAAGSALTLLDLSGNQLSGPIPPGWRARDLEVLHLGGNRLSGTLPGSIAALHRLASLNVSRNALNGTLDAFAESVGYSSLLRADLSRNALSGTFPRLLLSLAAFSLWPPHMTSLREQVFDASFNCLTGSLPEALPDRLLPLGAHAPGGFRFSVQGNPLGCPPQEDRHTIAANLPGLANATCREEAGGGLTTIGGSQTVPDAVLREMDGRRCGAQSGGAAQAVREVAAATRPTAAAGAPPQPPGDGGGGDSDVDGGVEEEFQPAAAASPGSDEARPAAGGPATADGGGPPLAAVVGAACAAAAFGLLVAVLVAVFVLKPLVKKWQARRYREYETENPAGTAEAKEPAHQNDPDTADIEMS
mmetsp:Transcript_779/g.1860  ORF Transcript_779/g.1860 Transcript_779/m.1860 type:complete len:763 (+) Transcript_779:476-2764(+)